MKIPSLWIFDIDGTCNKEVYKVLEGFKKLGRLCTFATGRGYLRTIETLAGFEPNAPLILEDGGRLATFDGMDICLRPFSRTELTMIEKTLVSQIAEIDFVAFCPLPWQKYCFLSLTPKAEAIITELQLIKGFVSKRLEEFFSQANFLGCVMFVALAREGCEISFPMEISWTKAKGMYNINPQGVNKTSGIIDLTSDLGIHLTDTAVIGNDNNDIPMFELPVGVKIAVGNNAELQQLATHCVDSPDELARLLKNF